MKINATHLLTCAAKPAALAIGASLLLAQPAFAQEDVTRSSPSVRDVALTPLTDLNLSQDPIPDILMRARSAPYSSNNLRDCSDIRRAVGDLDAVLGDDFDTSPPDDRGISATGIAQRVVGMFIPFRGIIREISGANSHEYEFREAIAAGLMRRAYLKGKGQEMGCPYPASPATPELVARLQATAANNDSKPAVAPQAGDGPTFVSRPVVQRTD